MRRRSVNWEWVAMEMDGMGQHGDPIYDHDEYQYLNLISSVLNKGSRKLDRTGTGTLSLFGTQSRYSLKNGKKLFILFCVRFVNTILCLFRLYHFVFVSLIPFCVCFVYTILCLFRLCYLFSSLMLSISLCYLFCSCYLFCLIFHFLWLTRCNSIAYH